MRAAREVKSEGLAEEGKKSWVNSRLTMTTMAASAREDSVEPKIPSNSRTDSSAAFH